MGKSINDLLIFLFFQALTDAFLYAKSVIHYLSIIYFAANILNKKKVSKNYPPHDLLFLTRRTTLPFSHKITESDTKRQFFVTKQHGNVPKHIPMKFRVYYNNVIFLTTFSKNIHT